MARTKEVVGRQVDGRTVTAFKEKAKKRGGRTIEQAPIIKWADQEYGFILEGQFVGIRQGKQKRGSTMEPGHLLDIAIKGTGEIQCWGCPAILHARLVGVKEGDELEIMLAGRVANSYGTESWDFVVNHYPAKD